MAPASKTLAMLGWSISARACRSASNRAITWRGIHPGLDDLEGDLAADRLRLLGHVDDAHPPFADLFQQLVLVDHLAGTVGVMTLFGGQRRKDVAFGRSRRPRQTP